VADLSLLAARVQYPLDGVPFHQWTTDGPLSFAFYRTRDGYLLRFAELADFQVSADGRHVTGVPAPGAPLATVEHLYLNQVLPLILSRSGKLVLHGSSVDVGACAIAFLADTGHGKSTLAAAFAIDGCPFLTDDGVLLDPVGAGYTVIPSHPSIRLWEDSQDALLPHDALTAPPVLYTEKCRYVAGSELSHRDRPQPLGAVYVLGPGDVANIEMRRLEPGQAVAAAMQHAFILDIEDRSSLAAHFDRLAKFAVSVPCFHLDYPRCYEALPRVIRAIRAHAASQGCDP